MIKYNDSNIIIGYIKQLLNDFNLPKCKVVSSTDVLNPNTFYINKDNSTLFRTNDSSDKIEISSYKLGKNYLNLTKNLLIKNNIYDSYTHKYLGDYLRFMRDYLGVDLMCMYNCFSNEVCYNINYTGSNFTMNGSDSRFKIYQVPVKFGASYTIAIDCHSYVEIVPAIVRAGNVVHVFETSYKKYNSLFFNNPISLDIIRNADSWNYMEDSLYLLIKVPFKCESSLTVLEGKYTNNYYFNESGVKIPGVEYGMGTTKCNMIKLLDFNSTVSHPFSDRLIEYLLGNAITGIDDISEDIKRVQRQLFNSKIHLTSDEEGNEVDKYVRYIDNIQKPGIWTQELQNALIGYYQDKKLNNNISFDSCDFIGYVDKDVERLLGK